ncbi:MAG: response regulator transcription factor [Limisphaerales bacterium]
MTIANHSNPGSANSPLASSHGAKPKILAVEDEMSVAMLIRILLYQEGCETEIATSVSEALELAQEKDFDLITLDIGIPGDTDGITFCRQLKENPRLKDVPIVIVSGRGSLEDQQRGLDAGAADYITKPFDAGEFAARVLSHINRRKGISC